MSIKFILATLFIAMLSTWLVTKMLIPYFREHQLGQYIREEGPSGHKSKSGTPTMGGIAIMIGIIIGILCDGKLNGDKLAIIISMVLFGLIGYIDDYEKIAKKNNLGLNAKQKILLQLIFSIGIGIYMMLYGGTGTKIFIPFLKESIDFGWLFIPFVIFVEVAMTNSVNLTDGLDGLASAITIIVAITFGIIGYNIGDNNMLLSGIAISGSLIGFLYFNKFPAKIFMGDTGSMALGGVLSAVAIVSGMEFILPLAGIIYVAEAVSVIIQVVYFKKTGGKRFFKMAPLHHHFELSGIREYKVVIIFSLFTMLASIICYLSIV